MEKRFRILSPDGFDIFFNESYTQEDLLPAFEKWKKRYEQQGYYSSNHGRISLEDLADEMTVIEADEDYLKDDDEEFSRGGTSEKKKSGNPLAFFHVMDQAKDYVRKDVLAGKTLSEIRDTKQDFNGTDYSAEIQWTDMTENDPVIYLKLKNGDWSNVPLKKVIAELKKEYGRKSGNPLAFFHVMDQAKDYVRKDVLAGKTLSEIRDTKQDFNGTDYSAEIQWTDMTENDPVIYLKLKNGDWSNVPLKKVIAELKKEYGRGGYPTGRAWTREHYHDNDDEDYEIDPRSRKVRARNRKYGTGGFTPNGHVVVIFNDKPHYFGCIYVYDANGKQLIDDIDFKGSDDYQALKTFIEKEFDEWYEYASPDQQELYDGDYDEPATYSKSGAIEQAFEYIYDDLIDLSKQGKQPILNLDKDHTFMDAFYEKGGSVFKSFEDFGKWFFGTRKYSPTGRAWTREHYHDNEAEDYEVDPAKRKVKARNRKYAGGGSVSKYGQGAKITGKGSRAKNAYNKEVDAYNWFVVSDNNEIESGFEYKSDAQDLVKELNEGEYKNSRWKVMSLKTLKQKGIDDPRHKWKYKAELGALILGVGVGAYLGNQVAKSGVKSTAKKVVSGAKGFGAKAKAEYQDFRKASSKKKK